MNCPAVRELLAEHALGGLPAREGVAVDRHVAWCAACRKEVRDLQQAAAAMALALPPVAPPEGLEDRVVAAVRERARRGPRPRRRAVAILASVTAAAVAAGSLGWGAVMADRAQEFEERAAQARQETVEVLGRFRRFLQNVPFRGEEDRARFATLAPVRGQVPGGGAALVFVSPNILDFAVVIVNGVDPAEFALPLRVRLVGAKGAQLRVGRVTELDEDGAATVYREFRQDLRSFTAVVVEDAAGNVVLRGRIGPPSALAP